MELRYGMNPHQPATITPLQPGRTPFRVVRGEPSYINVLDALGAWQLVREASACFDRPAAASFKHVSPAGAALAGEVDAGMRSTYDRGDVGAVTSAYVRARDADPKSSYGDFVAVSHPVDAELAAFLQRLACDGIIAPAYDEGVVGTLAGKKRGTFLVLEGDPTFEPPTEEVREVYGLRLTQQPDDLPLDRSLFDGQPGADDLLLGMIVLRYTQSNSVAFLKDGMALGIGAGQQSRIDCTQLAGSKAQTWWLRRHPEVLAETCRPGIKLSDRIARQLALLDSLGSTERDAWLSHLTDVSMVSDGAIPFRDNIDVAHGYGVRSIAEPGGSLRSTEIIQACKDNGITLTQTGIRLFRH
ncbi:phosphoribosylaminoimidazolecarboxamide formyltransferase/IMP cyclohydrolase [Kribbella orskensis]|uniref:Phosphoribosylaminoimidazolecarboxamide formyltransferase/IMP cyclohydrolase n=1 Tax=Kribbella orskensis TaxID=2512216 RepID=A0ABY2BAX7_9ACTN|nr:MULTISPECIES: 5-aminoimidazole-4-carboxamide ribonucleotide transformylase [Kribbella]TCN33549.1 phosphoribosylaminoimidazolecarboxamide formyltransferase/IMP cyclohydrolase [Kribbella sp. VKM Ac-2500]TCO14044.1 phosphoribosylaminoimidazolecarboxamide formyltransferase/IMP cyclohydrolase [Kribbella orskensis]